MPRIGKTPDGLEATVEAWNAQCPVGTQVRYYPVLPQPAGIPAVETTTRSEAWTIGSGHGLVLLTGKSGGVSLLHLEVLTAVSRGAENET